MSNLVAQDVSVEYVNRRTGARLTALDHISMEVSEAEFVSIVGPSGCGKTTFLNAVAGLLSIDSGMIRIDGVPISGPGSDRAMVFQNPALLPWRTVLRNVSYGLELKRIPHVEAQQTAERYVELVGLRGFQQSYPYELSGGMQQRVNLARALAYDPKILLMDEPFAALDAQTRELMQRELLRIWLASKKTVLFITHQISEALYLSDRVFVFSARPGRLLKTLRVDTPRPRALSVKRTPRFLEMEQAIWETIEKEAEAQMLT